MEGWGVGDNEIKFLKSQTGNITDEDMSESMDEKKTQL